MNKKAQGLFVGFIVFAAIVIGLLVMSPFLLKIWNTSMVKFGAAVGNQSVQAGQAVGYVNQTYIGWFDSIVLFMFFTLLVLLIVSSVLIDVSPFFIIFYVIVGIIFFMIAPAASPILYKIYEHPSFASEVAQIPGLAFLVQNFWPVMLGIYIFSGLVIFVKITIFPSGGRR